jgi:type II secretory pathway component GspD/PulD (secretin)
VGLIQDSSSTGNAGIPWLKDVPLLGFLSGTQLKDVPLLGFLSGTQLKDVPLLGFLSGTQNNTRTRTEFPAADHAAGDP